MVVGIPESVYETSLSDEVCPASSTSSVWSTTSRKTRC